MVFDDISDGSRGMFNVRIQDKSFQFQKKKLDNFNDKFFYGDSGSKVTGNFLQSRRGQSIRGSIVDTEKALVYQLFPDAEGRQIVRVRPSDSFPDELDPHDDEIGSLRKNKKVDHEGGRHFQDGNAIMDIMVLWTKKAECANSNLPQGCTLSSNTYENMLDLVELAVAETNVAYVESGVKAELRLVHAYREESYVESSFVSALNDLMLSFDGFMDDVHSKRERVGADLVALMIDDPELCGFAVVGPSIERMFSVTSYDCATGRFAFGHEIGHNLVSRKKQFYDKLIRRTIGFYR